MNDSTIMRALVDYKTHGAPERLENKLRAKYLAALNEDEKAYNGYGMSEIRGVTIISYCGETIDIFLKEPIKKIKPLAGIEYPVLEKNLKLQEGFCPGWIKREVEQISKSIDWAGTHYGDFEFFCSVINRYGYGEYEYQRYVKGSPLEGTLFSSDPETYKEGLVAGYFLNSLSRDDVDIFTATQETNGINKEMQGIFWNEVEKLFYSSYDSSSDYAVALKKKKNVISPYKMDQLPIVQPGSVESQILAKSKCYKGPSVCIEKDSRPEERKWWGEELQKFWETDKYIRWAQSVQDLDTKNRDKFNKEVKIDLHNDKLPDVLKKKEEMSEQDWKRMINQLGGDPIKVLDRTWRLMLRLFK